LNISALPRHWPGVSLPAAGAVLAIFGLAPLLGWAAANEGWKLFGGLLGIAVMPIVLRWPIVCSFGLYVLVLPFSTFAMFGTATIARFAGIFAAGMLVLVGLTERRLVRAPAIVFWWGALALWAVVTVMWALDTDIAIDRLPTVVSVFALFLIAVSFQVSQREMEVICVLVIIGGVAAAIMGYVFGQGAFDGNTAGRATLVVGEAQANPNGFASSLLPSIALALASFFRSRRFLAKIFSLAAIGILGVGIYISISRAAIVALVVLVGVMLYRIGINVRTFMPVLILLGMLPLTPGRFFTRVMSPFTGADETGSGRTEIWAVGWKALQEFWVWGAGLSNFPDAYERYVPIMRGGGSAPHNTYLGTWVELGLVGLILMLVSIALTLLIAWRHRRSGSILVYAIEACLLGHVVMSLFGDTLWGKRLWLLCILLVWAVRLTGRPADASVPARGLAGDDPAGGGHGVAPLATPRPL
jgi:O-antigen ligase